MAGRRIPGTAHQADDVGACREGDARREQAAHPKIIDREDFELAQATLSGRGSKTRHKQPPPRSYPLRGVLLCGLCGRRMSGKFNYGQASAARRGSRLRCWQAAVKPSFGAAEGGEVVAPRLTSKLLAPDAVRVNRQSVMEGPASALSILFFG